MGYQMARKRVKGAGRKPQGPYQGNSEMLGVRVRPEIRRDLEQLAATRGWSVSQEVQRALVHWIDWRRGPCGPALVNAIFKIVEQVKTETGESLDSPFTAAAVRGAVDCLLLHFWPPPLDDAPLAPPSCVKDSVARGARLGNPPEVQAFDLTPTGVAHKAAGYVILRIENAASEDLPGGLHPSMLDPEGYWEIRQALGSGHKRFQQRLAEAKGGNK
jgi:hypothetical protein